MEWTAIAAIGMLAITVLGMLYRMIDQKVDERQHSEFVRRFDQHREDTIREMGNRHAAAERRLETLENTRPTTGELEAKLKSNPR